MLKHRFGTTSNDHIFKFESFVHCCFSWFYSLRYSQEVDVLDRCYSVWPDQASLYVTPLVILQLTHYVLACPHHTQTPWKRETDGGRKYLYSVKKKVCCIIKYLILAKFKAALHVSCREDNSIMHCNKPPLKKHLRGMLHMYSYIFI